MIHRNSHVPPRPRSNRPLRRRETVLVGLTGRAGRRPVPVAGPAQRVMARAAAHPVPGRPSAASGPPASRAEAPTWSGGSPPGSVRWPRPGLAGHRGPALRRAGPELGGQAGLLDPPRKPLDVVVPFRPGQVRPRVGSPGCHRNWPGLAGKLPGRGGGLTRPCRGHRGHRSGRPSRGAGPGRGPAAGRAGRVAQGPAGERRRLVRIGRVGARYDGEPLPGKGPGIGTAPVPGTANSRRQIRARRPGPDRATSRSPGTAGMRCRTRYPVRRRACPGPASAATGVSPAPWTGRRGMNTSKADGALPKASRRRRSAPGRRRPLSPGWP